MINESQRIVKIVCHVFVIAALLLGTKAQSPACSDGPLLFDLLRADPNLTYATAWAENSGVVVVIGNSIANTTIFMPTDQGLPEPYKKYVGTFPEFGQQGVGFLNGTGKRDNSAAGYNGIVGFYADEDKLIAAGSVNTVWGMANGFDATLNFSRAADGMMLVEGLGDFPLGRVVDKKIACNGVMYVLDVTQFPADTADQVASVDEEELTRWRLAVANELTCSQTLTKAAEDRDFLPKLQTVLSAANAEYLLDTWNDTSLAITLMVPTDDFAESVVDSWAKLISGGNATLTAQVAAQNRLYAALPGVYCPEELLAMGTRNSLLGELLGEDLPLTFKPRRPGASSGVSSSTSNTFDGTFAVYGEMRNISMMPEGLQADQHLEGVVLERIPVCNSEIWVLDSMPLMNPDNSPVLVQRNSTTVSVFERAAAQMTTVTLPPRHLTCNPVPYADDLIKNGGSGTGTDINTQGGSSGSGSSSSNSLAIAIAIGVGVGVGVAALVAASVAFIAMRKRRQHATTTADNNKQLESSSGDLESGTGTGTGTTGEPSSAPSSSSSPRVNATGTPSQGTPPQLTLSYTSSGRLVVPAEDAKDWKDWIIPESRLQFTKRPDGSDFVLGRGSWGVVRRAVTDGVQPVAVKTLPLTSADNARAQTLFARETQLLGRLRNPNVVQFIGIVPSGDSIMLVTELMEGGDLRAALNDDAEGKLRWNAGGRSIAMDIILGLAYLHANKCVHRDIKSRNILLDASRTRAKLADVGLARILESTAASSFSDGITGTFPFSAPELLMGERCTEKVDIYSYGIVLWEIVTGEKAVRGQLRPLQVDFDACSASVVSIVDACTGFDPKKRPSAQEVYRLLSEDTEAAKNAAPVPAVHPPAPAPASTSAPPIITSAQRSALSDIKNPFDTRKI